MFEPNQIAGGKDEAEAFRWHDGNVYMKMLAYTATSARMQCHSPWYTAGPPECVCVVRVAGAARALPERSPWPETAMSRPSLVMVGVVRLLAPSSRTKRCARHGRDVVVMSYGCSAAVLSSSHETVH